MRGLGGVVSPLLAGFSLTAIAQLLTAEHPPPQAEWAIAAFACAVGLLLFAMQLAFFALARDPLPSLHLDWHPEALVDEDALRDVRRRQAETFEEMVGYWRRCNRSYDLGLIAFLAGVALLLIPDGWSAARAVALGVAGVALALELWWALANRFTRLRHPVVQRSPSVELEDPDPNAVAAILDPARREAARHEGKGRSDGHARGGAALLGLLTGIVAVGLIVDLFGGRTRRGGGGADKF